MSDAEINYPCGRPDKGFMIICDSCEIWFHGPCARENSKSVSNQKLWFCRWCCASNKKYDELLGKIKGLENELNALKESVGDGVVDRPHQDYSEEVFNLKKELSKVTEERDSLSKECLSFEENSAGLKTSIQTSTQEILILKKELSEVEENGLCAKCLSMEENIAGFKRALQSSTEEILNLKNELSQVLEEKDRLLVKYESLVKEHKEVNEELRRKRKQRLSLSQQRATIKK